MLILNEQKYAEDLYIGKNDEVKSAVAKIGYVTRYLLHAQGYNDADNYKYTVEYMKRHHDNFDESSYSNLISDAIKKAKKRPFYIIDSIKITKTELDIISSLNNIRAEKMLFVLLCMAKQQAAANNFTNGLVKYSLPELCKTARVSVPADDREYLLYQIIQHGFLGYPKKNDTKCLFVTFIDNENEAVIDVNEIDCQELAYVYLQWKNNGGYNRCDSCGRLFKKSGCRKYCYKCSKHQPTGDRIDFCIDCGKEFRVDPRNQTKCRCNDCQKEVDRENTRKRVQRYRIKNM